MCSMVDARFGRLQGHQGGWGWPLGSIEDGLDEGLYISIEGLEGCLDSRSCLEGHGLGFEW